MDAIINIFFGFVDRLGALVLTIADMIVQGRNFLAEVPYQEIGQRLQRQVRRTGINTLIFIGAMLLITLIGLGCGYTGHWILSSIFLLPAIVGFGLLLLFERLVFAALKITIFSIKLAALAAVYPGFLATKGLLGEIIKILKLPGKPFEWLGRFGKIVAIQLNTWGKKSPEEIQKLFDLMKEPEEDHPNQQAWDENWARVESELEKAAAEAEKVAQTIFFWTEALLGFISFMGIFFFVVAPNSQAAPTGLGLDNTLSRIWTLFSGNRVVLLAVTLVGLFTAFMVSKKRTPGATNQ